MYMSALKVNPATYQDNPDFSELFNPPNYTQCIAWDDTANICWDDNPFTWDEVCLVLELASGGAVNTQRAYEEWAEEKKRQFITVYVKVKGDDQHIYTHEHSETHEKITTSNVTIQDIELVVERVLRPLITVQVEN